MSPRSAASTLPTGAAKVRAVDAMFDAIAPRYDRLNRILTFGLDVGWRRRAVRALGLPRGARVLDLACGTGDLCRELAAAGMAPVGVDRSAGMLHEASTRAPLVRGDALGLPFPDQCADGIVSGFALRNFESVDGFLSECRRVLRSGGRFVVLEVSQPRRRLTRAAHALYFRRIVPLIGGLLSDREAYRYLPRSTAYLPSDDVLVDTLRAAGFRDTSREALGLGAAQLLTGTRS